MQLHYSVSTLCVNCRVCRMNNKTGHTQTQTQRHQRENKDQHQKPKQCFWYTENIVGIFPWLLVQHQLHHQRRITHIPPRPERILQAACSLPKHHFFQLALKNIVTLCAWQNREPGRLVGLPYIIGDLTNIFSSVRLCHIVQCQHFSIGTIYPRVLE